MLKREPDKEDTINIDTYFDEDGSIDSKAEIKDKEDRKGAEEWTGKGELILPDFSKFISFLQAMILEDDLLGTHNE